MEPKEAMQPVIAAALEYVRELFDANTGSHDTAHTLRVWRNALRIAATEPDCNMLVVELAALLHDADDYKLFNTENNENARAFLTAEGIEEARIEEICAAINSVSFTHNRGRRPGTAEGRIVQDADRLDAIGAVGVARCFAYGGEHCRPMEESLQHFHDKLLRLTAELNTESAKALAAPRHAFLETFLREYAAETEP